MSLLTTFITSHAMKLIELEFTNHSSEIQSLIINEVTNLMSELSSWLGSKIDMSEGEQNDHE